MNYLIIVAGGNGERMNLGYNKIFAKLAGRFLIYWTLRFSEENEVVDKIIISAKKNDIEKINLIVKKYRFKKVEKIIEADRSRQESTFKVLQWLKDRVEESDLIGIHNAVNPFIFKKEVELVYKTAKKYKASLLAQSAKDTVKITNKENIVEKTPLRKYCWYAQTPQVACFGDLWKAFVKADKDKFLGTDDTQLLERIGIKAKLIPCSSLNFKITFPEDLILAKKVLKIFLAKNE